MRMGMYELLIIFGILVLLFGAKKLPQLADGMGKAIRNFKKGLNTDEDEDVTPSAMRVEEASTASEIGEQAAAPAQTADQKG